MSASATRRCRAAAARRAAHRRARGRRATWSRGTATSRSGWRPDPNRREKSEPLASLPTTSSLMRAYRSSVAPKRGDIGGVMVRPAAEGGGAGDQHGRAGVDRLAARWRRRSRRRPRCRRPDPAWRRGWRSPRSSSAGEAMNFCPPKPGIDAHHQHQVDLLEHIVEHLGRGRRIERHAGLLAQRLDPLDGAMEVRSGLGMDGDDVGAGLGEGVEEIDRPARSSDGRRTAWRCAGGAPSPRPGRWSGWARNARPSRRYGSSRRRPRRSRGLPRRAWRNRRTGSTGR